MSSLAHALHAYLPQDRLRALARGESLPDRTHGAALFADISGFTPLTESLTRELGPRRGAEELARRINAVYGALIAEIERYGGSVIGFSGDAMLCWFDQSEQADKRRPARQACACAFALQVAMRAFPDHALKVAVASGPARRLVVGDPDIHCWDTLAGATVARTASAEQLAQKGEVVLDEATVQALGEVLPVTQWRTDEASGERFAVAGQLEFEDNVSTDYTWDDAALSNALLNPFILPAVYERELSGQGAFLTEFRPCVALFARFIGIDYDLDDAQVRLDTFVRLAQGVAARYEGVLLNMTIGDKGSYAYIALGALSAHEDDARRALKTALDLRAAADTLGFLAPLQIGVTQGVMRVGTYGGPTRTTYGALGDEVNLAARLMQAAMPGEIVLSGAVRKSAARDFAFEARTPLSVKGKAEPLPVFVLEGIRRARAIRLQEPTYTLPMVGRERELEMIRRKLEAAQSGRTQMIGIVGEAGLGKSRLTAEVIRAARKMGFAGFGGACQSDGVNTPYLVWKAIWQAFFDIDSELPLHAQIARLEDALSNRVPERIKALPVLGALLNLDPPDNDFTQALDSKHRQNVLHGLLEDCLRAAAQEAPVLILLEDMHWIDAPSLNLLSALTRALSDSRVCFVMAYRPVHGLGLPTEPLEKRPNFTRIELHELSRAEAEQVVRAKVAHLFSEYAVHGERDDFVSVLAEQLTVRAQGNPFYLEELINFLHDRRFNLRDPKALENIELPDSLHTLILSRIDQLSDAEKTTLRVASIIGRLFRARWLIGYYPKLGEWHTVKKSLERLAKLDITPLDTSEPEPMYLFKHIVTHEATYESLPFALRAQLHERLAGYLESLVEAKNYAGLLDVIAHHYGRSENSAKQREYFQKAAQAAMNVSAFYVAADYLTRLLSLLPADDTARSALALRLANARHLLGDNSAAHAAIRQAQAAAVTQADRAAAYAFLGEVTSSAGDYQQAQAILAEAIPMARAGGDRQVLCRALYALGDVSWRLGKLDEAHAALDENLTLARDLGDVTRELSALIGLGLVAFQRDLSQAEHFWQEAHVRAVAVGDRARAMVALNNLATVAFERKSYEQARAGYWQVLTLAREISAQQYIVMGLINLGYVNIELRQCADARSDLRAGLSLAIQLDARPWMVCAVAYFGSLAYTEGQTERGLALWGLASRQSAWSSENQYELNAALSRWALDPAVAEAGLAKGAELDWDATVQDLLKA